MRTHFVDKINEKKFNKYRSVGVVTIDFQELFLSESSSYVKLITLSYFNVNFVIFFVLIVIFVKLKTWKPRALIWNQQIRKEKELIYFDKNNFYFECILVIVWNESTVIATIINYPKRRDKRIKHELESHFGATSAPNAFLNNAILYKPNNDGWPGPTSNASDKRTMDSMSDSSIFLWECTPRTATTSAIDNQT